MTIPAFKYNFPETEIDWIASEIRRLLEGGSFLTLGEHCERLEAEFAQLVGVSGAAVTSSGTSALETILRHLDVKGREVIVPTNTFAATVFAVVAAGGTPVFVDCGDDLCLDVEGLRGTLGPRTGAVIVVHIGGVLQADLLDVVEVCREAGVPLVEDAAHAHGSELQGRGAGSFGTAGAFSLFSTKLVTSGEGGIVVSSDHDLLATVRLLRDQAKVNNLNRHEQFGSNWRLSEFQAIVARSQLRLLPTAIKDRAQVGAWYAELLHGEERLQSLPLSSDLDPNFYKVTYVPEGMRSDEVGRQMGDRGVRMAGTVYDTPCHEQPVFERYRRGPLPAAERLCASHICLPVYVDMTRQEVECVVTQLMEVVK